LTDDTDTRRLAYGDIAEDVLESADVHSHSVSPQALVDSENGNTLRVPRSVSDPVIASYAAEADVDTPAVVVDIGILHENIQRAARVAGDAGVNLRPHIKTHKIPRVAQMQMYAGAVGIQVAKLGEAEVMVEAEGVDDIFVGYPIVGERKLERLCALAERATISVSLDSLDVARGIARAAAERGVTIRVLLELDTGLNRIGVEPGLPAVELADKLASLVGIELVGVLTHEGQIYAVADADEREAMVREACRSVVETAAMINESGHAIDVVSVGSSGSFRHAVDVSGVTEVRPGTYVFNDRTQLALGAADESNLAAVVVATVVSRPTKTRLVLDAGSKSLSSDRMLVAHPKPSFGQILGHADWNVIRLSEEHAVVDTPADAVVAIGDRVAIVPNHICTVINLADTITVVDRGVIVDEWRVAARGRVQ
jgi:D-serine deaminase-like pyridoxal phosphate-dependent protein